MALDVKWTISRTDLRFQEDAVCQFKTQGRRCSVSLIAARPESSAINSRVSSIALPW